MARNKKKVLLIEPNYANKFPPVGLMKIASYYKMLDDWEVVFYKGDLKQFVAERVVDKLIFQLKKIDSQNFEWDFQKDILFDYIRTRKKELLNKISIDNSDDAPTIHDLIENAKDSYQNKTWEKEWDRVGITTLFTFYWDITIETIKFARDYLVKDPNNLMIGGVLASIQPNEIEAETGIRPHVGILRAGDLDKGNKIKIDELPLDYSILDEIDYQYPMSNAYYRYTTRGCVNKCAFCAVSTLEPEYQSYIPLKEKIARVTELYGPQKDLLLMDNNVLASEHYKEIINEIKECGFTKGAKFKQPNLLEISIRNLKKKLNDRAYIKKSWKLMHEFYNSLKGEDSYTVFATFEKFHLNKFLTTTKENLLLAYEEIKEIYLKNSFKKGDGKLRFVDFNQGLDARLFTQEKANLLGEICIRPVRIAFDDVKLEPKYTAAIKMCVNAGIKDFSNYLLYNFIDRPIDLYKRLRINVDLCDKLGVSIYSFPMKYHPIRKTKEMSEDFSHNRDYIGKYWNRKYIRAIQAVLNSTKGKIGRGTSFFNKAFGNSTSEFLELLEMPEAMLIYRFFFEWLGTSEARKFAKEKIGSDEVCNSSTKNWRKTFEDCKTKLSTEEFEKTMAIIHTNNFDNLCLKGFSPLAKKMLSFYCNARKDISDKSSIFAVMKHEYDKHPTIELKRHSSDNEEEVD